MFDKREVGLNSTHAISVRAELYALVITFVILASLSLIARLYVRIQARNQGLEDWLVVAAMVCCPTLPGIRQAMLTSLLRVCSSSRLPLMPSVSARQLSFLPVNVDKR